MKRSAEQIAEINGMVVAKLFLERDDLSPHGPGGRGRAPGAGAPQEERFSNCRSQGTSIVIITSIVLAIVWGVIASLQAQTPPPPATLFQNVRVFDGKSGSLSEPQNVLVRGNKIDRISTDSILIDASASTVLIDGERTHADARADRHALAHDAGAADACSAARWRHRPPQHHGRRRGDGHAHARVHNRSGLRRAGVRA